MGHNAAKNPITIKMLTSNKIEVRLAAIRAIGRKHTDNAYCIQTLVDTLTSETQPEIKAAICITLAESKTTQPSVVLALSEALGDDSPLVREHAISALINFVEMASPAIGNLLYCLKDSSPQVRANAAWLLGKLNNPATIITESLCDCLNDAEALVRWRAANALKQLDAISIRIVLSLENALLDPNHMVAKAAKDAFISIQERNSCQVPTSLVA